MHFRAPIVFDFNALLQGVAEKADRHDLVTSTTLDRA